MKLWLQFPRCMYALKKGWIVKAFLHQGPLKGVSKKTVQLLWCQMMKIKILQKSLRCALFLLSVVQVWHLFSLMMTKMMTLSKYVNSSAQTSNFTKVCCVQSQLFVYFLRVGWKNQQWKKLFLIGNWLTKRLFNWQLVVDQLLSQLFAGHDPYARAPNFLQNKSSLTKLLEKLHVLASLIYEGINKSAIYCCILPSYKVWGLNP